MYEPAGHPTRHVRLHACPMDPVGCSLVITGTTELARAHIAVTKSASLKWRLVPQAPLFHKRCETLSNFRCTSPDIDEQKRCCMSQNPPQAHLFNVNFFRGVSPSRRARANPPFNPLRGGGRNISWGFTTTVHLRCRGASARSGRTDTRCLQYGREKMVVQADSC